MRELLSTIVVFGVFIWIAFRMGEQWERLRRDAIVPYLPPDERGVGKSAETSSAPPSRELVRPRLVYDADRDGASA